jgi:hypothetical protein
MFDILELHLNAYSSLFGSWKKIAGFFSDEREIVHDQEFL